jgi:phosphonate transport system substrate-binding protein
LAWLEVLLGKERLGRAASFFAAVKVADKPQACILPLFFGSVDACVVDEISLNLAKEMNPQVGKLKVLARSGPLIEGLIAMPAQQFPYLKELLDSMLSLHQTPRGRQLLTVFRTDRLVPVQPGDLDSARDLWRDNSRLIAPAPNRMPGSERGKERY